MPDIVRADRRAVEAWNEAVECLRDTGILSRTDLHLLASYACTTAEYYKCLEYVRKNGYENDKGTTNSYATALSKHANQHLKLISELGLSPSSRTRLQVEKPKTSGGEATLQDVIGAMQQMGKVHN
jgi:P27 family predicted phage terminase small subunit